MVYTPTSIRNNFTQFFAAWSTVISYSMYYPDNKFHGANMGPTWALSAPDGPRVGPMNLAIWELITLPVLHPSCNGVISTHDSPWSEEGVRQGAESSSKGLEVKVWDKKNILYRKISNIRRTESQNLNVSSLAAVFAQSFEAMCQVENEDVVGAAPTGDAPTTSEWSTIWLPTASYMRDLTVHFWSML